MCKTPVHVTSSQLIASEIFPVALVKALLYPGAATNTILTNMTVPSWDNLLDIYNLTTVKEAPAVTDLQRLEVHFSADNPLNLMNRTYIESLENGSRNFSSWHLLQSRLDL